MKLTIKEDYQHEIHRGHHNPIESIDINYKGNLRVFKQPPKVRTQNTGGSKNKVGEMFTMLYRNTLQIAVICWSCVRTGLVLS